MTQDTASLGLVPKQSTDGAKSKDMKRDKNFQTKVVIRRLPPSMTEAQFVEQVSPVPSNDYFHFVKADLSLGAHAFTRVYLNFLNQEDVFIFKDKFDGYVFIDTKGNEYPAIVEFAPFQKIPKRRAKKRDAKCGTLAEDPEYLKFVASLENPDEADEAGTGPLPSAESYLEELEARERDLKENGGAPKQTTPLIEYLKQRKLERQRVRDEKREERKRRELERKKARDEERRKKKSTPSTVSSSSSHDKFDASETHSNRSNSGHFSSTDKDSKENRKDTDSSNIKLMLLKNPERDEVRSGGNQSRSGSHHSSSYQDAYSGRDRGDKNSYRDRTDRDREDRYRSGHEKGNRDRNERGAGRDKERGTGSEKFEKHKESEDKNEKEKPEFDKSSQDKYDRGAKDSRNDRDRNEKGGYLSRRERERQREKAAAARERERAKLQKEKEEKKVSKTTDAQKVKGFASKRETSFQPVAVEGAGGIIPDDPAIVAAAIEKPSSTSPNNFSNSNIDGGNYSGGDGKDPRTERRIRNKDRPSLEIYRPGMRRLSSTGNSSQGATGSSSGKNCDGGQNSQNENSADNSPRSYSPINQDQSNLSGEGNAEDNSTNNVEEDQNISDGDE